MDQQDKDIRVSDAERDAVVRALGEHASVGRLTLDEFEDRSSKALTAKTRGDLDALTSDLPDADAPAVRPGDQPQGRQRPRARWLVSILGSAIHTARSRAVGTINSISILGGGEIDLRNAEIEGGELTINAFSLLGGPDIFVPDTIEVDPGGIFILGGVDERGAARDPRPGAPVVRLRTFALLGGATLYRVPAEMRGRPAREIRASMRHEHAAAGFGPLGHHGHHMHHSHHGSHGHDGPLGAGGDHGPFGPHGPFGANGPFGAHGPFGPRGPFGPEGPLGPRGPFGRAGSGRGDRGPSGDGPDED